MRKPMMKMYSLEERMSEAPMATRRKYYPTVRLKESLFPPIKNLKTGKKVSLTIEGRISDINQHNNEPRELTLELRKVGFADIEKAMLKKRLRSK